MRFKSADSYVLCLVKNSEPGFPNHESIYSDCHRPLPSPNDATRRPASSTDREDVSSRPFSTGDPLYKFELSDLRIADKVRIFSRGAEPPSHRRRHRRAEDKHPLVGEWVLRWRRPRELLLNDSRDVGTPRRAGIDWIGWRVAAAA